MVATSASSPVRLVTRTFLVATAVAVGVVMLIGLLVLAVNLSKGPARPGTYAFSVRYVAPAGESAPGTVVLPHRGDALLQHETITVTTSEPMPEPVALTRIAILAPFAVFYAGCILVLVLIRRVWTRRSFTRPAAVGLGILGALVVAVAKFVPWLELRAVEVAVRELGLPTSPVGTTSPPAGVGWVVPQPYGLESIDWPLAVLGVVLVFAAVLLHRGTRLQADVDGLV